MTAIAWLRRSMRVHDNTAMVRAAADHGTVVPLYVVDTDFFETATLGYPRVAFWRESLLELRDRLQDRGNDLVIRHGSPQDVVPALVDELDADAVYTNRDYTPYARERDTAIADTVDVVFNRFKDIALHDRDEILTNSGTPYKVYSYYRDKWFEREKRAPQDVPGFDTPTLQSDDIPPLDALGFEDPGLDAWWTPGRTAGLQRLEAFRDKIGRYDEQRDYPAQDATSKLSPHLKFGTVSIREAFQAAEAAEQAGADADGVRTWQEELAWRDFYYQVLWHWPETTEQAFLEQYRDIDWHDDEEHDELWAAFVHGETGYPFVDAAMRQLRATGWMHNRPRMVVASFAAKDLHIDWRRLHDYFKTWFVDAEISAMVGGIQWAYSIGTDAQPYFRVFNPWKQGERFDPDGDYIRAWVDELQDVPDDHVHRPHQMPEDVQAEADCVIGEDYPAPVVDHDTARETAVQLFEDVRDGS